MTGAAAKNPQRFRDRAEPGSTGPPGYLTPHAKKAWALFAAELPWLTASDRLVLEMASNIRGRFIAKQKVGVEAMKELRLLLQQMGATPASRSKVSVPDDPNEDPEEALFSRPN